VCAEELAYYRAHFQEAVRKDAVVCLECGAVARVLGAHTRGHGMTIAEYKEKWGYNRKTRLVILAYHERMRHVALARDLAALSPPDALAKAQEAKGSRPLPVRPEARLTRSLHARARYASSGPRYQKVSAQTLRRLVEEGLAVREIAERTGLTPSGVRLRLRSLNLPAPRPARPLLSESDAQILALRQAGLGDREVGERLDRTAAAVRQSISRLRRRGFPVPAPTARPPANLKVEAEVLAALVEEGLTTAEIARRTGLTHVRRDVAQL
jgi:DNA-binding NarL/FixJ family response regulator